MKRKQLQQGKRNSRAECPRLKRFISDISQFNEDHRRECDAIENHGQSYDLKRKQRGQTRKERRKEERKLKKMKKEAFMQRKPIPTKESLEELKKQAQDIAKKKKLRARKKKENKNRKKRKERQEKEKEEARQQELKDANKAENRAIKQLERQLKLNKRKSKTIPLSFKNDGLDYLLEVIDSDNTAARHGDGEESDEDLPKTSWDLEDDLEDNGTDNDDDIIDEDDGDEDDMIEDDLDADDIIEDDLDEDDMIEDDLDTDQDDDESDSGSEVIPQDDVASSEVMSREDEIEDEKTARKVKKKKVHFADDPKKSSKLKTSKKSKSVQDTTSECVSNVDTGKDSDAEFEAEAAAVKEDIYGRLTDYRGKVVSTPGAYVPPSKRLQLTEGGATSAAQLEQDRMRKQLKGLLNRLSEANLQSISNDIEALYRTHSRMGVTEVLCTLVLEACVSVQPTPPRLIMEHILLIAILHVNIGMEVGAHLLETVVKRLDVLLETDDYGDTHEVDNLLTVLSNLYNFKVVQSVLVVDVLKKLVDTFNEKDIQMILLMLKNVGPSLRKEDPATLKDIILLIQSKAATADTSKAMDQSRVRFMLEVLLAIKNNNMRKIPNYDPSHMEHLGKLLKNYAHSGTSTDTVLCVSFAELLDADNRGRWWLVGSAWSGPQTRRTASTSVASPESTAPVSGEMSAQILHLAKQQRMNTNIRKNIFCIIMTSEDFVDAFEKLLHIGLKQQQEREIIHVIMDLCLQEKTFNPFYALLAQKFCEYDRRFQMTVQFSLWDKFKVLEELGQKRTHNLAGLLSRLLVTKALSLSVFKVIEFGELDKARVRFIKAILRSLLTEQPDHVMCDVFSRISSIPKLQVLREGLKLFMRHFILRDKKNAAEGVQELLKQKVELAERSLTSTETKMML